MTRREPSSVPQIPEPVPTQSIAASSSKPASKPQALAAVTMEQSPSVSDRELEGDVKPDRKMLELMRTRPIGASTSTTASEPKALTAVKMEQSSPISERDLAPDIKPDRSMLEGGHKPLGGQTNDESVGIKQEI